uniref:Transmembrane protein 216 n=1 Tax=Mus spicilegus TaxID=10103 RepID=A0A8C6IGW3_MUSSI
QLESFQKSYSSTPCLQQHALASNCGQGSFIAQACWKHFSISNWPDAVSFQHPCTLWVAGESHYSTAVFPCTPRKDILSSTVLVFTSAPDKRLSSTPLEVLFFLNGWYYATYFLLELLIFLYKGLLLPYPTANLVLDVVMLLLYLGIEVIRLFFGTKGNLCQRKMPLGISVALTFPSAMMASYYLLLQTYVLRLEAIMNSILLFFCGSELLLEMLTLATFSSMDRV